MKNLITTKIALFVLIALFFNINTAQSGHVYPFSIYNPADVEVKVTLHPGQCYNGAEKGATFWIKPYETKKISVTRTQGHGCNGENGHFRLEFSPAPREGKDVNIWFTNDGAMWADKINAYPGTLKGGYAYETCKWPKASKVKGQWSLVCAGICNLEITEGFSNSTTNSEEHTDQVKHAVSVSVTAGVESGAYSAESTASYTNENTMTNTMKTIVNKTKTKMQKETIKFTSEQMRELGIHAVWRWEGTTKYDGHDYIISTVIQTCTSGPSPPTYKPYSQEAVGKCNGG
jgi:hypothetical protein